MEVFRDRDGRRRGLNWGPSACGGRRSKVEIRDKDKMLAHFGRKSKVVRDLGCVGR